MKTVKRILYILLIVLGVTVIGYLIFTGSRLPKTATINEANILFVSNVIGGVI